MKIWIDISTPPQLMFLRPIMAELERRGHELVITTRHSTETVPLSDHFRIQHKTVGAHGGATMIGKTSAILWRAMQLMRYLAGQRIELALGHGSYSQAVAAFCYGIPFTTFEDYEGHPALHILCRAANKILVPDVFEKSNLFKYGATPEKIESYEGIKEDVYLTGFQPDRTFRERLGVPQEKILVAMRPPSLVAAYHRFKNPLFDQVIEHVASQENTFIVLLPRERAQREQYERLDLSNIMIPDQVLNGPDLVHQADLVIGGGGTMNREAVAAGTPAYTVFKGQLGSVDQHLINAGRMTRIENDHDLAKINIRKKDPSRNAENIHRRQTLVANIVTSALRVAEGKRRLAAEDN